MGGVFLLPLEYLAVAIIFLREESRYLWLP